MFEFIFPYVHTFQPSGLLVRPLRPGVLLQPAAHRRAEGPPQHGAAAGGPRGGRPEERPGELSAQCSASPTGTLCTRSLSLCIHTVLPFESYGLGSECSVGAFHIL